MILWTFMCRNIFVFGFGYFVLIRIHIHRIIPYSFTVIRQLVGQLEVHKACRKFLFWFIFSGLSPWTAVTPETWSVETRILSSNSLSSNGNGSYICIALPVRSSLLECSGMDYTVFTHHTCLHLVSIHQTAPPLTSNSSHLIAAYYSFIDPKRMKGWVGLVSWPTSDGLPI